MTGSNNSDNFTAMTITNLLITVNHEKNTHTEYCSDTRNEDYKLVNNIKDFLDH